MSLRLLDRFPSLIWRCGRDAKCDYFNQTWLDFRGRSLAQEIGDGWTEGVHPQDLAGCLQGFRAAFRSRQPFVIEYRLRRRDGEYRWILDHGQAFNDPAGRFAGYIGSCFDVTERKLAEEQVRFQASLLDQVRNAVIATDLAGRIVYWNRFAEILYQWKATEVAGRNALDLIIPADRRGAAGKIKATLSQKGFWEGEFEVSRKDGSRFTADFSDAVIRDGNGVPSGLIGVSVDVTERKRAEKELQASKEQLRALTGRMQKVREDESERIAREIHDELGQALTALNLDLARVSEKVEGVKNPPLRSRIQRRIKAMTALLATTVRSVQRISTELRPRLLDDLGLSAALVWQAGEFAARTGIRCRWTRKPLVVLVRRDQATAYFRIFQEILTNVARHAHARLVRVKLARDKGNLIMEVADDGIGFDEKKLLDRKSLGLLGMRERAVLLDGQIECRSTPGGGTRITVTSPIQLAGKRRKTKTGGNHDSRNQNSHR